MQNTLSCQFFVLLCLIFLSDSLSIANDEEKIDESKFFGHWELVSFTGVGGLAIPENDMRIEISSKGYRKYYTKKNSLDYLPEDAINLDDDVLRLKMEASNADTVKIIIYGPANDLVLSRKVHLRGLMTVKRNKALLKLSYDGKEVTNFGHPKNESESMTSTIMTLRKVEQAVEKE